MTTFKQLSSLKGRQALITGGLGHLGRVIAETLAELGADLVLVDRLSSVDEVFISGLTNNWGVKVHYVHCDLELDDNRAYLINFVKKNIGALDILVNNAAFVGTSELRGWATPFENQTIDTWRRALEVNLTAVFDLCQGFTPLLQESTAGSIINIASIYGSHGPDWSLYEGAEMGNPAAYGASKGGLIQLGRWLACTLAPNIRVNSLSPGGIFRGQPETFVKRYVAKTPLRRMASEDDLRGAIAYLATDLSKYVTGQNLEVDGGWGL